MFRKDRYMGVDLVTTFSKSPSGFGRARIPRSAWLRPPANVRRKGKHRADHEEPGKRFEGVSDADLKEYDKGLNQQYDQNLRGLNRRRAVNLEGVPR